MQNKIMVSGIGCSLVDRLYTNIPFTSGTFLKFLSKDRGDGGLIPGHLVFKEEFERFAGESFASIIEKITGGKDPDTLNVGGPAIVALIHAAQMLNSPEFIIRFYGCYGSDYDGSYLIAKLAKTPVDLTFYTQEVGMTPSTIVLSDPEYDHGNGERIFINSIGVAWDFSPDKIESSFFNSEITVFGGTALVPSIHDNLSGLLSKAKLNGCLTIVNTVFDFRSEVKNPGQRWPMGDSDKSYRDIDLLITDHEEALRLSGENNAERAISFFRDKGVKAAIITNGSGDIIIYAENGRFTGLEITGLPVSKEVAKKLNAGHKGDTTGCGDNFAGGVIFSLASQIQSGCKNLDLMDACIWGIASGGFACFYVGGTYFEEYPGDKYLAVRSYYERYLAQVKNEV